ncbi:MAG: polymer-forming cytoskeletal protein [Thermoplasmata archaeon]
MKGHGENMTDKKRVDRIELGVMDRGKVIDVYAREFVCTAAGKVQGNLDSEIAEVKGVCKVGGDVRTSILKVGGSMKVMGNVTAELIRAKGALKVEGWVDAPHLRIAGATKVRGDIRSSEEILVQGVLKCKGNMEANKVNVLGAIGVDGDIKANEFAAELGGRSSIRTLVSKTIKVKAGSNPRDSELIAKTITGQDIYLENTVAELVEGQKVTIGPGCTISRVKSPELEVHKGAKVGKRD